MKNTNLFSENRIKKSTIKYFVISFSAFIVLLAICSVILLMHSLDYDIGNLVEGSTTTTEPADEIETSVYSVDDLEGKSNLLFIVEAEAKSVDFMFVVSTDFDSKSMMVKCVDGSSKMSYDGTNLTVNNIYYKDYEVGVKKAVLENFEIPIDKFVVFDKEQFEDVLSLFNGFSINVESPVNYKSKDFNLSLTKGIQELSPNLTYKYLRISDNLTREKIICDIIKSVLTTDYIDNSEKLFTSFVNLCSTDISVIDYSETVDRLKTYCYADDKFYPEVYVEGDEQ